MQLCHTSRATSAVFDDPNLVSSSGLVPVLALARSAGLGELAQQRPTTTFSDAAGPDPAHRWIEAKAREEAHGLGLFVRSLVGLDREAATTAFDRYLSDTSFSTNQLRFVQMVVEELTANGVLEVAGLYESPFTDHAPNGPDSLFTDPQVDDIVAVLDDVRTHALPDVTVA